MAETTRKYTIETAGAKIDGFLKMVFGHAGLRLSYEMAEGANLHPDIEDPDIVVRFSGPDLDVLMANKCEALLALEQLTLEVLKAPSDEHSRLCFDANDYRLMRMEELRMSAVMAAGQVLKSRRPFRFSAMTSRERRIIHLSLRSMPEIKSESYGMGPTRSVVLYPADFPAPPVMPDPPPIPRSDAGGPPRPGGGDRRDDRRGGPPRRGGGDRDRGRGPRRG